MICTKKLKAKAQEVTVNGNISESMLFEACRVSPFYTDDEDTFTIALDDLNIQAAFVVDGKIYYMGIY